MSLGQIIRERREQLRMTQDQVAAQAAISKPYLSNIETGKAKNPPTDSVLRALEVALNFTDRQLTTLAHLVRTPSDIRQSHELLEAEVQKLRGVLKMFVRRTAELSDSVSAVPGEGAPQTAGEEIPPKLYLDILAGSEGADGNVSSISAGMVVPVINKVAAGYPHCFTDLDYPPSVADEYVRCPDLHDPQAFAARIIGDSMEPDYRQGDIVVFSPNVVARDGDDCFVRFAESGGTTFKRMYQDDEQTVRLQSLNNRYPSESYPCRKITGLWPAVFRIQRLR